MRCFLPRRVLPFPVCLALAAAALPAFAQGSTPEPPPITQPAPPAVGSQPASAVLAAMDGSACLDAPGAATTNGLALAAAPCASTPEQNFSFIPPAATTGTGSGTGTSAATGMAIHAPGAFALCMDTNDSGAVVQLYCLPTASQQWTAAANADTSTSLINGATGQCLTASNGGYVTSPCTAGTAAQEFTLGNVQSFAMPAAPISLQPPVSPIPNAVAGIWQAGSYNGLPYRILFPQNYDPTRFHYTFLLFLHGDGEVGTDNISQLNNDFAFLGTDTQFMSYIPVIILAPQCPPNDTWGWPTNTAPTPTETLAVELTEQLTSTLSVDPARIGVTGLSIGGVGTYDMLVRFPGVFTFAAPIAGATQASNAPAFVNTPMVVVHGGADGTIPAQYDEDLYAAVQALGGSQMLYVELPGFGHDVWDATYTYPPFWYWVLTGIVDYSF